MSGTSTAAPRPRLGGLWPRLMSGGASGRVGSSRRLSLDQRVNAPGPCPGGGEEEPDEAEQNGRVAAVQHGPETVRSVPMKVRNGHLARDQERDRPGEEPDQEQSTAERLDQPSDPGERADRDGPSTGHDRAGKREELRGPE